MPGVSRYIYMAAVLDALRALSRSARSSEVYDWLIREGIAKKSDRETVQQDGGTRFKKEVRWARKELFDAGLLGAPAPGVWALTSSGAATYLDEGGARALVGKTRRRRGR
jgi:restriction system protein